MFLLLVLIAAAALMVLVALLWERLLLSRLIKDPVALKLTAAGAAWITCGVSTGYLIGGNGFAWPAPAFLLIPAGAVAAVGYRLGLQGRLNEPARLERTFE
jgi:hypothetical protein